MLASDHFDFSGHVVDHHQQPIRYAHGRRMVLQTFSRVARKTGRDHDEPDGAISAGDCGTGQGDFSGPAMPVHSESKKSGLPDRQIFTAAALPHP